MGGTPNITPLPSPGASPCLGPMSSPPASPHSLPKDSSRRQKVRGPSARTVRVVRQLSEIHQLLPLSLPLAPADLKGKQGKTARKQERRKKQRSRLGEEDN